MPFSLDPEHLGQVEQIVGRYPNKQAACIPVLHLCQVQNGGWISEDVIGYVASLLELSAAHVMGVVTFYSLFNRRPVGKHQVWVCRTLSCALRGSEELLRHCQERLDIHPGETTADGRVTLHTAECLASCGSAPAIQVDDEYHENLDIPAVDRILDRLLAEP
jgi:NADH-quinone oxidoreductase subunit E